LYRIHILHCVTFTAVNQYIALSIGGVSYGYRSNFTAAVTGNQYIQASTCQFCAAGAQMSSQPYTSVSLAGAGLTPSDIFMEVKYEGTS
jgi:hypothetical protein